MIIITINYLQVELVNSSKVLVSLRAWHRAHSLGVRMILYAQFDHTYSGKVISSPVKTSWPPDENINETPVKSILTYSFFSSSWEIRPHLQSMTKMCPR